MGDVGLVLLGLVLLAACGGEPRFDVKPMQFNIDAASLGEPVSSPDLGIQFQPPIGWEPFPAAQVDSVGRALEWEETAVDLVPRYVFLHPTRGSVLSVALLQREDSVTFEEQMAKYGQVLARHVSGDSLRQGAFLKDDLHIQQFLLQPPGVVNFKLVLESETNDLLQFDYVVPRQYYPAEIKAIESSIGSIRRLE